MTTRLQIINEGPYDVRVEVYLENALDHHPHTTVKLAAGDSTEPYIWKGAHVKIEEILVDGQPVRSDEYKKLL